jgi:spermidine synthase
VKRIFLETNPSSPIHYGYRVKKVLYRGKSPYQKILAFDSPHHGRVLALDNIVQITTREEVYYHESLVHPVMQAHPDPHRVLVIGGGDGGTVRELVKYPALERIIEVELDEQVVRVARKYFPRVAAGYKDPRVHLLFADGYEFLRGTTERFDIIILDLTDPIGPAKPLFEEPFYRLCAERLTETGFLSAQTESLHYSLDVVSAVYHALKNVFPVVEWVIASLAMYPGNWWTFSVASKQLDPTIPRNSFVPPTQYYLRDSHAWFLMPRALRDKMLAQADAG